MQLGDREPFGLGSAWVGRKAPVNRAVAVHAARAGSGARYSRLHRMLMKGMAVLGFETYLPPALQAPIIVTFRDPGPLFEFEALYARLQAEEIVLYPGKLTRAPSFRVGCMGAIDEGICGECWQRLGVWVSTGLTAPVQVA